MTLSQDGGRGVWGCGLGEGGILGRSTLNATEEVAKKGEREWRPH